MIKAKNLPTWEISPENARGGVEITVFDAKTNNKLSPSITLVKLDGEKFSNLSDVPAGLYTTQISKGGYFKNTLYINVVGGKTQKYNTSLRKNDLGPSDLAVTLNWAD